MSVRDPGFESHPCYRFHESCGLGRLELSCLYGVEKFYTEFEQNYDPQSLYDWMELRPWVPLVAVAVYIVAIFAGQEYMKTRERWNWRFSLGLWNLGLTIFSVIGFFRVVPQLVHNAMHYSVEDQFCYDPRQLFAGGASAFWLVAFIWSKFFELIDTFFIVIHKKPLIFLHWYHHVTVLLFCWHSFITKSTPSIFFCALNYGVHAVMYFYYFLMAARMKPKWFNPMILTVMQISQMVVGVAITMASVYYYNTVPDCTIDPETNKAGFIMYGSYLFLFVQFFFDRYFGAKVQTKKKIW